MSTIVLADLKDEGGSGIKSAGYDVEDEDGGLVPGGATKDEGNGNYNFIVNLRATKGDEYLITVGATDGADNKSDPNNVKSVVEVIVPHDQRNKKK